MERDPLDLPATPERLRAIAAAGALPPETLDRALEIAAEPPGAEAWRRSLDLVLLALGSGLFVAGLFFLLAWNWDSLGRLEKLSVPAAAVALAAGAAARLGVDRLAGKVLLTAASLLVGALLAVFGLVYQTGADPYGLFLAWAALILPWVLVARFPWLWLLLVALVDTSVILYAGQVLDAETSEEVAWVALVLAGIDGGAWAAWEALGGGRVPWMAGRTTPWFLGTATLAALAFAALVLISGPDRAGPPGWIGAALLLATLGAMTRVHRRLRPDLALLASGAVVVLVVLTCLAGRVLYEDLRIRDEGGLFILGLLVVILGGALALWLRRTHAAMRAEFGPEGEE